MPSKIEWTQETWNPITGCTPVSEGCANCYARRMANRFRGRFGYPVDNPFRVTFHSDKLRVPYRWRNPRQVFVCSMGDLFHENVSLDERDSIFGIMTSANSHIYQILTKRPQEMFNYYLLLNEEIKRTYMCPPTTMCTLRHIQIGVSVENQRRVDERIPILLDIPAAVRFISYEPALEAVDFSKYLYGISWIIAGGETGQHARPADPDWFRNVRDQCRAAGVPFFMKQMSDKQPIPEDLMIRQYPEVR